MARDRHDRGFALLLVLIALATLSLIIAASVDAARRFGREASAGFEDVRLDAAIDAAIATAARDLADAGAAAPAILSQAQKFEIGRIRITARVRPEAGRIDLNSAPPALIAALLAASGVAPARAHRVAVEIADWRDGDSEARETGAEASEYIAAGRSYVPTNRAFESVSELGLVLDGGDDLPTCLAPDVTVFTHSADIDSTFASPRVRRAVQAVAGVAVAQSGSIIGGRQIASGSLFEIEVSAKDIDDGRDVSSQTVVRITGNQADPVWILSPAAPAPDAKEAAAACKRLAASR